MKNTIVLATAGLLMSFQAFGLEFQCDSYDLGDDGPTLEARELNLKIEGYSDKVTLTSPLMKEPQVGEYKRFYSPLKTHYASFGSGTDKIEFFISDDPEANVLQEYVLSLGHNYDLSGEELEDLEQTLRSRFLGLDINGSMLILSEVKELMSCRRL